MIKKVLWAGLFLFSSSLFPTAVASFADQRVASESEGLLQQVVMDLFGRNKLFLERADIDLVFGGRTRQEGFYFDKPLTFRDDYNDRYRFIRSKYNIDMHTFFGRRQFGEPVVRGMIRMTAFNVWDNFDVYTPVVEEPVAFSPQSFLKKGELAEHHHDGTVTELFMEDGWFEVNFDRLINASSQLPVSFRAGYFKHKVGRGVSLGTYFDGAINYMGWETPGNPGNNTNSSPGLKLTLGHTDDCAFELYYSKWRKRSHGPDFTREETRAKRLDVNEEEATAIQRGIHADRDLFSARIKYHHDFGPYSSAQFSAEPYLVYVNAPELKVEFDGDASARITTFGCMTEYKHNGWTLNVEAAFQAGTQTMHTIDRNHIVIDDAYYLEEGTHFTNQEPGEDDTAVRQLYYESGQMGRLDIVGPHQTKYQSHVLLGTRTNLTQGNETSEQLPYRAYYASNETRHINANRMVEANGQAIRYSNPEGEGPGKNSFNAGEYHDNSQFVFKDLNTVAQAFAGQYGAHLYKTGVEYFDKNFEAIGVNRPDGLLFNAGIPFGAGERFRQGHTLHFKGMMAMADLAYTTPTKEWTVAGAVAYISGDEYPFDTLVDKAYRGFVPLKDADYTGHSVQSYGMLAARKIGRPTTFSDTMMHAPINYESITNLKYIGLGATWRPCQRRNKLTIESNALYFWQDVPPFKWDKTITRDFGSEKMNSIYVKAQSDLGFTGGPAAERASSKLGFELNTVVAWRPIAACEVRLLLATFVPDTLYKDIDGMPSAYTIRQNRDGDWRFDSFGTQIPVGGMLRLTYWF